MTAQVDPTSLPFAEQIAFFKGKLNLPTERWNDIQGAAHDRAFVVAGAMQADLLQDLRSAVQAGINGKATLADFRNQFNEIVHRHGWTGWTGEGSEAGYAWRTRTIYETNLRTSYAAGRMRQLQDNADVFPYWQYVHNEHVATPRPEHLAWHGKVLAADDPWWKTHYPPNGFGCKCSVRGITRRELAKLGKEAPDDAPPVSIDPRTGLDKGISKGWGYAPGANALRPLKDFIDQKLIRLEAPIGALLMQQLRPVLAQEQAAAWREWLNRLETDPRAKSEFPIVGAISPEVLAWLAREKQIVPKSAEIAIRSGVIIGDKARRHEAAGDALPVQVWESLPDMIAEPLAVLFDTKTEKLVFILPEASSRRPQLVVEFDYKTKTDGPVNLIVSGYRPEIKNLNGRLIGGGLALIAGELTRE